MKSLDAMPDKEITLVIYGDDSFIGTVECLVKNALGMADTGNTEDEGLVSMVYRLGKEEMPAKNIMVAARPRRDREYVFLTPKGSIIGDIAAYLRSGRNY